MVEQKIDLFPVKVPDGYDMMQMLPSRSFVRLFVVPVLITYLLNRMGQRGTQKYGKTTFMFFYNNDNIHTLSILSETDVTRRVIGSADTCCATGYWSG
jgi:hypothetical protein